MGMFFVIMGVALVVVGIVGRKFSKADVLSLSGYRQRSSAWSGRLLFIVVGVLFVAWGIRLLMGEA